MHKVDAVILAGAPAEDGMVVPAEYPSRAMVQLAGKTMLQWIVDAMCEASCVERVIAVGKVTAKGLDLVLEPSDSFLGNMMLGIEACSGEQVLVASSDIPLATGAMIDDFLGQALGCGADMCYPIIPKRACVAKYPELKRTYLKTREGTFTGGNMLLLSREFCRRNEQQIAQAYAMRKKPMALAASIGYGVLVRAIVAQIGFSSLLPIPMLEQAVGRMLGGRISAIISEYPEIGEDADRLEELKYFSAILQKRIEC